MPLDHEVALEHLQFANDVLRTNVENTHPLLAQLLQLGLQILIIWLSGKLGPLPIPTPAPVDPKPAE